MEDSMWMDNLEEFVFEERKAVTYKWLSRALSVHVNVAKQMLFAFAEKNSGKVDLVYLTKHIWIDQGRVKVLVGPKHFFNWRAKKIVMFYSIHVSYTPITSLLNFVGPFFLSGPG